MIHSNGTISGIHGELPGIHGSIVGPIFEEASYWHVSMGPQRSGHLRVPAYYGLLGGQIFDHRGERVPVVPCAVCGSPVLGSPGAYDAEGCTTERHLLCTVHAPRGAWEIMRQVGHGYGARVPWFGLVDAKEVQP